MSLGYTLYAFEAQDEMNGNGITETAGGLERAPTGDERVLRDLEGNRAVSVMEDQAEVPKLTEVQIRQAVTVIPRNYGKLN